MGNSEQTFYRKKKKFQGMGVAEVRRLRILEEENRKLRQLANGGGMLGHWGVAVQGKGPFKRPA